MSAGSAGTLETVKKLLVVLVASAALAAVLTWLAGVAGLLDPVQPTRLASIGTTLSPAWTVGIVVFVLVAFLGILYAFFAETIREKAAQTTEQWADLPDAAKALFAGLPFAIVAAVAVVLTDAYAWGIEDLLRLAIPLVVWLAVTVACYRHLTASDRLAGFARTLATAGVIGGALAIGSILLDRVVADVTLQGYVPLAVLLVGAPLVATLMVRSQRREGGGLLSKLLVKTGFAQVRELQTVTVALAIGLLVAVIAAFLVSFVVDGLLATALTFVVVWFVATYLALRWFQRTTVAHSDLVIVNVHDRSSGSRRELAVTNERDERVDLRNAKIRDTEYDLYRTNIEVVLAPGQTETFDIPPGFSLFPSSDDLAVNLPFGLSLRKSADAPVIVTRNGEKFKLRWADGVVQARSGQTAQPGHPSADADRMEDNA
jgi:hypothetical protein